MTQLRVLVVDDDPWILRMVTASLEKLDFAVETARDGQQALDRATASMPALIITDVMMPVMDGWTFVQQLRASPELARIPVLFLTALGNDEDRLRALGLRPDEYIPKPFRFDDLERRVMKALANAQQGGSAAALTSSSAGSPAATASGSGPYAANYQGGYPPPYPQQPAYPGYPQHPQQGAYPGYPPQQQSPYPGYPTHPAHQGYPAYPHQGGYPPYPQQGGYPGYPPPGPYPGYPPQPGAYPGYPQTPGQGPPPAGYPGVGPAGPYPAPGGYPVHPGSGSAGSSASQLPVPAEHAEPARAGNPSPVPSAESSANALVVGDESGGGADTLTRGIAPKKATGITGRLEQLGLSSLLVMMEMERKDGVLSIAHAVDQRIGRIFLRQGQVIRARIDKDASIQGADCVYEMLAWQTGKFSFAAMDVDMENDVGMTTTGLLMEGARRIDEANRG